jgi:hypothetical protein
MSEQESTPAAPRPAATPASVRGDGRLPANVSELSLDQQADALEELHSSLQARLAQGGS